MYICIYVFINLGQYNTCDCDCELQRHWRECTSITLASHEQRSAVLNRDMTVFVCTVELYAL